MRLLIVTHIDHDRRWSWSDAYAHCEECGEGRHVGRHVPGEEFHAFPPRGWSAARRHVRGRWTRGVWCPICAIVGQSEGAVFDPPIWRDRRAEYPDHWYSDAGYEPLARERVAAWIGGPWAEFFARDAATERAP